MISWFKDGPTLFLVSVALFVPVAVVSVVLVLVAKWMALMLERMDFLFKFKQKFKFGIFMFFARRKVAYYFVKADQDRQTKRGDVRRRISTI